MAMSIGLSCECCCVCGPFCSGGQCGDDLPLQGTTSGSTNGGCAECAALNTAFSLVWERALTAATWNASSPGSNGRPTPASDAKDGTKVCQWTSGDFASACSSPFEGRVEDLVLSIYLDADDKWHACILIDYLDGFGTYELSGDAEFPSSGVPIDCTAFSVSIPLSIASGSPFYCNPPTAILIENAP
jgi:hypothetical protein